MIVVERYYWVRQCSLRIVVRYQLFQIFLEGNKGGNFGCDLKRNWVAFLDQEENMVTYIFIFDPYDTIGDVNKYNRVEMTSA